MKKIICLVGLALALVGFAFADEDDEFTWAEYEELCYQYGTEPSYDTYIDLVNNPQCLGEDFEEVDF